MTLNLWDVIKKLPLDFSKVDWNAVARLMSQPLFDPLLPLEEFLEVANGR